MSLRSPFTFFWYALKHKHLVWVCCPCRMECRRLQDNRRNYCKPINVENRNRSKKTHRLNGVATSEPALCVNTAAQTCTHVNVHKVGNPDYLSYTVQTAVLGSDGDGTILSPERVTECQEIVHNKSCIQHSATESKTLSNCEPSDLSLTNTHTGLTSPSEGKIDCQTFPDGAWDLWQDLAKSEERRWGEWCLEATGGGSPCMF